jgi:hypothetical protein
MKNCAKEKILLLLKKQMFHFQKYFTCLSGAARQAACALRLDLLILLSQQGKVYLILKTV